MAILLSKVGIEVYLPRVAASQQRGKAAAPAPFFPGYLFGRLDPQLGQIRMAEYTPGVLHVVGYGSQPWAVPEDIILAIQQRVARLQGLPASMDFRPGDRVIIARGPFRDVEAIFDGRLSAAGRVRVLIQMLRRLCPAEVHLGHLRSAKAAGIAAA